MYEYVSGYVMLRVGVGSGCRGNIVGTKKVDDDLRRTYGNNLIPVSSWYCNVEKRLRLFLTYLLYCVRVMVCDEQGI